MNKPALCCHCHVNVRSMDTRPVLSTVQSSPRLPPLRLPKLPRRPESSDLPSSDLPRQDPPPGATHTHLSGGVWVHFGAPGFVGHRFQVGLHSEGASYHILTLAWAHEEPHVMSFLLVGWD